jgi:hypothetical protein
MPPAEAPAADPGSAGVMAGVAVYVERDAAVGARSVVPATPGPRTAGGGAAAAGRAKFAGLAAGVFALAPDEAPPAFAAFA